MPIYQTQEELQRTVKWLENVHKTAFGLLLGGGALWLLVRTYGKR